MLFHTLFKSNLLIIFIIIYLFKIKKITTLFKKKNLI